MKKIYVILLATIMLANTSITAFAAEENSTNNEINQDTEKQTSDTSVSFEVAPSYTITIPKNIELEKTNDNSNIYEKETLISAEDVHLKENEYVKVTLTSDFNLSVGENSTYVLSYIVIPNACESTTTNPIKSGDELTRFATTDLNSGTTQSICFKAEDPIYAGIYTDTVTFTISVATDPTE